MSRHSCAVENDLHQGSLQMTNEKSQISNLKLRRRSHMNSPRFGISILVLLLLIVPTLAQDPLTDYRSFRQRPTLIRPEATAPSYGEFTFIRTIYDSPNWGYGYRRG